jgi:hypothetical protein
MKHLRRFNENKDNIKEYLDSCFIEFIDKGVAESFSNSESDFGYITKEYGIDIQVPDCWFDTGNSLDENIKSSKIITEFYLDIENSIEKVKIKYPDANFIYRKNEDGVRREVSVIIKL